LRVRLFRSVIEVSLNVSARPFQIPAVLRKSRTAEKTIAGNPKLFLRLVVVNLRLDRLGRHLSSLISAAEQRRAARRAQALMLDPDERHTGAEWRGEVVGRLRFEIARRRAA
jgi:hypothetical protein